MAWTVLRTVTDSVSYVTAADHNETKANFDIVGGADGATKTGNWYVSGNVGIGTSSPAQLLTINAAAGSNRLVQFSASDAAKAYIGLGTDNFLRVETASTDDIRIRINTADLVTFKSGGNVGIGTTSPGGKLHVWGESYLGGSVSGNTAILLRNLSGVNRIDSYDYPITQNYPLSILGSYISLSTTDTERIRINNNGVGIGTTSPGYQLTLSTDSAAKPTSNTWTISSDARVKEVIGPYTRGVADIVALEPRYYRLNGAFGSVDDGRVHVSVIAQEAQATWPEMIGTYDHTDKDADDVETVTELLNLNTNELQWALVNAIKELAQRVEALER